MFQHLLDPGAGLLFYWLLSKIPNPPVETKRTTLPFTLNTSINLMAAPITLLLILGIVFRA